jgi:hypothetical protein
MPDQDRGPATGHVAATPASRPAGRARRRFGVCLDGAVTYVRGKGGKNRRIPIESTSVAVLEHYLDSRIMRFPATAKERSPRQGIGRLAGGRRCLWGPMVTASHAARCTEPSPDFLRTSSVGKGRQLLSPSGSQVPPRCRSAERCRRRHHRHTRRHPRSAPYRVLGIDTPETKKPGYTVGCWGPEATQFAKDTRRVTGGDHLRRNSGHARSLRAHTRLSSERRRVERRRGGSPRGYCARLHLRQLPGRKVRGNRCRRTRGQGRWPGLWGPPCYGETASVPL